MPCAWSESVWECMLYFGPSPMDKNFPDLYFGGADARATGRQFAREREANRKKRKREQDRAEAAWGGKENPPCLVGPTATASAILQNNRIWSAELVMKYGGAEAKSKAMVVLLAALEPNVEGGVGTDDGGVVESP
mmetsp:Transcript_28739/g.80915  ORF Transcript_28739/g.80915 Transcript_28739/m.80915 type:complete len:135 (-) Transcript_28739:100-504(-)